MRIKGEAFLKECERRTSQLVTLGVSVRSSCQITRVARLEAAPCSAASIVQCCFRMLCRSRWETSTQEYRLPPHQRDDFDNGAVALGSEVLLKGRRGNANGYTQQSGTGQQDP